MKQTSLTLLLGFCALFIFSSCKKDDDTPPKKEPSIVGDWILSAFSIKVSGAGNETTYDIYGTSENCEKDNGLRFKADNSLSKLNGNEKCDSYEATVEAIGTWSILKDRTKVTFHDAIGTYEYNVNTLNQTTLSLQRSEIEYEDGVAVTYTAYYTFKRQ